MIKKILYDPFDSVIKDTNPALRIPLGFAGGLHDRDLNLVRFGWRDYDPNTGRWTAPDPMGEAGGDPDWYGYCLDDPVNMIDPMGLAYAGNDFGPGYDGTSGSAYGPTADGGWGYKDGPVSGGTGEGSPEDSSTGDDDKPTDQPNNTQNPNKKEDSDLKEKEDSPKNKAKDDTVFSEAVERFNQLQEQEEKESEKAEQEARTMALARPQGVEEEVEISFKDISNWGPGDYMPRDTTPKVTDGPRKGTTERLNRDLWGTTPSQISIDKVRSFTDPIGQEMAEKMMRDILSKAGFKLTAKSVPGLSLFGDMLTGGSDAY